MTPLHKLLLVASRRLQMTSLIQQCCCCATDIAHSYTFVTPDRSWGDESGLAGNGNAAQSACWHPCAKRTCKGTVCWGQAVACTAPKMGFNLFFFFLIGITARYFPFSREGKDAEDAFVPWWCWPLPASITSTTSQ